MPEVLFFARTMRNSPKTLNFAENSRSILICTAVLLMYERRGKRWLNYEKAGGGHGNVFDN